MFQKMRQKLKGVLKKKMLLRQTRKYRKQRRGTDKVHV